MNVNDVSVVILPLMIWVLIFVEVDGPINTSKSGISGTRISLPSAFTVYDNLKVSPITTASGAEALNVTSAALATTPKVAKRTNKKTNFLIPQSLFFNF